MPISINVHGHEIIISGKSALSMAVLAGFFQALPKDILDEYTLSIDAILRADSLQEGWEEGDFPIYDEVKKLALTAQRLTQDTALGYQFSL
jgi:hypothetical protein